MNPIKLIVFLFTLMSFHQMKGQDTIPNRDSLKIKDSVIVDSSGQVRIADQDTLNISSDSLSQSAIVRDTSAKAKHSPRRAAIRSAIIPGWGQVYNKKYWKVPIVYAAIGIPVGTFIYNKNWYTRTRDAARMIASNDTANYKGRVDPQLWVFFSTQNALGSLLNYRNEFRRNMDYSILITLLFWGLNVVDATVDAHLKDFDVSDDLSLRVRPTLMNYSMTPGISLVFTIGKHSSTNTPRLY